MQQTATGDGRAKTYFLEPFNVRLLLYSALGSGVPVLATLQQQLLPL